MIAQIERLFECIGEIDDLFLIEAEEFDIAAARSNRLKKVVKYSKYSAAGLAGVAAVTFGTILAVRALKRRSA